MEINEELGNKSGIAITYGQMGKVFYALKNYKEALRCYLTAFSIFDQLGSPYKDLAGRLINKLKEEIGDELFEEYYNEIVGEMNGG